MAKGNANEKRHTSALQPTLLMWPTHLGIFPAPNALAWRKDSLERLPLDEKDVKITKR
jgi:hypothetical protein